MGREEKDMRVMANFLTMPPQHLFISEAFPSHGLWPASILSFPLQRLQGNTLQTHSRYTDRSLGVDQAPPTLGSEPLTLSAVGIKHSNAGLSKFLKGYSDKIPSIVVRFPSCPETKQWDTR